MSNLSITLESTEKPCTNQLDMLTKHNCIKKSIFITS